MMKKIKSIRSFSKHILKFNLMKMKKVKILNKES